MTVEPQYQKDGGTGPNVVLLIVAIGYVAVNCIAIMSLIFRVAGDAFAVLGFFAFVAPPGACILALLAHFGAEKRCHPLAITAFIVLMILMGLVNLQFLAQASAAV